MDRSRVIYLVSETWERDAYGVNQKTEASRKAYADISSVTRAEWDTAGRNGFNPQYVMKVFSPDYSGEKIVQYNGERYTVYRTYQLRDDIIELYVERREGNA